MKLVINANGEQPIYEQIKLQIKEQITSGELVAGTMLPSIRMLAKELKIGIITAKRAYDDLTEEGFTVSIAGKGVFIADSDRQKLSAAARGVDVRLLVPHIPDKKIIFAMTRSYYPRLLKAGVQIYEYEQGFIHLKSYLADGKIGMIGTINLDYRSLVHHFENGVWLYDCDCLSDLKRDMDETLEKCIRIRSDSLKHNLANRFFCSLIKIFAPLM